MDSIINYSECRFEGGEPSIAKGGMQGGENKPIDSS